MMTWSELGSGARVLRALHAAIAAVDMSSVGYLWICALSRRRDRLLRGAFVVLALQGLAVVIGGGDCPLAPLQRRLGDPSPVLGLALPAKAAKAVFPTMLAATLGGVAALALRPQSDA
jgi:hypothetical protein